jgi:TolB protein
MLRAIVLGALVALWAGPAHAEPVGQFGDHRDIGAVSTPGRVTFAGHAYRLSASGANIWDRADAFHYAWTERSGDLHIAADIAFEGAGADPHRKAGVMIRQNLTPGSPYADVMVHGDGLVALQYREVQDGPTRQIVSAVSHARRVRLEREGDFIYFSVAGEDGVLHHAGGSSHRLSGALPGRARPFGA